MAEQIPKLAFFELEIEEADGSWKALGRTEFKLFANTPITTINFGKLCNGVEYPADKRPVVDGHEITHHGYKGLTFHRIQPNFVLQMGCWFTRTIDPLPITGTPGTGGANWEGVMFPNENENNEHFQGCLSMANKGNSTSNGSQIFVCLARNSHLDEKHVVFGTCRDQASYTIFANLQKYGARDGAVSTRIRVADCGVTEYYTEKELDKIVMWQAQKPDGGVEFWH